jgi:nucleotide-binding universal stress UspA family protein
MTAIKKILVAICFSEYCSEILGYAIQLARDLDAELVLANVINVRDVEAISTIESRGYDLHAEEYVRDLKVARGEQLATMIAESGFPREKAKIIIKVGHPFAKLLKAVTDEEVDLVVMGTKGRSNLPHLLVGSVADKMFRHCPVPVLSYRDRRQVDAVRHLRGR